MQLDYSRQQAQIFGHVRSFVVESREALCSVDYAVPVYAQLVGVLVEVHVNRQDREPVVIKHEVLVLCGGRYALFDRATVARSIRKEPGSRCQPSELAPLPARTLRIHWRSRSCTQCTPSRRDG